MKSSARKFYISLGTAVLSSLIILIILTFHFEEVLKQDAEERNKLKIDSVIESIEIITKESDSASDLFFEFLRRGVRIQSAALRSRYIDGVYEGPMVLPEGFVIQWKDNSIIMPDGLSDLTDFAKEDLLEALNDENNDGFITTLDRDGPCIMGIGHLDGDYYYIDKTDFSEYSSFEETYVNSENMFSMLEEAYDCSFSTFMDMGNGDYILTYRSGTYEDYLDETDEFMVPDILYHDRGVLTAGGQTYQYFCSDYEIEDQGYTERILFVLKKENYIIPALNYSVPMAFAVLAILIAIIAGNAAAEEYVRKSVLTERQKERYTPERMRNFTAIIGLIGLVVVILVSFFTQSIAGLRTGVMDGRDVLDTLLAKLDEKEDRSEMMVQEAKEWYLYYAHEVAQILHDDPSLINRKMLSGFNHIIGGQYLMVFDENGAELASSADYVNFRITDLDKPESDFRRLLLGVGDIVHEPEMDQVTGIYSQLLGVLFNMPENELYGGLILALDPETTLQGQDLETVEDIMRSLELPGDLLLAVDPDTHEVVYSSDPELAGEHTDSIGIRDIALQDDFMDRFSLNGNQYYGITSERDGLIYFAMLSEYRMMDDLLPGILIECLLYLAAVLILAFLIMPRKALREAASGQDVADSSPDPSGRQDQTESGAAVLQSGMNTMQASISWYEKNMGKLSPENAVALTLQVLLGIYLLFQAVILQSRTRFTAGSMMEYLLRGQWSRGANLFSLAAILLSILGIMVALTLVRFFFSVLNNFLGAKGVTICRLIINLLNYIAIVLALYFTFNYLGIETNGLLASVGVITFAISLGSHDLVTDILAGLSIVFEGDFQVGDIVEIGGFKGKVLEIGVRSTKIMGAGNNIKIISNRDVKNVLNLTQMNSSFGLELEIPAMAPIQQVEEVLRSNLESIGKEIPQIINGPHYVGVTNVTKESATILITAECREESLWSVKLEVNRRVRLLLEKEVFSGKMPGWNIWPSYSTMPAYAGWQVNQMAGNAPVSQNPSSVKPAAAGDKATAKKKEQAEEAEDSEDEDDTSVVSMILSGHP